LPWTGYFYAVKKADVFVLLDHVQFERNSWQSRNRIKGPKGPMWLTVPTHHKGFLPIKDIEIDNTQASGGARWAKKHWLALKTCYSRAPFFDVYAPFFESVYGSEWTLLAELNIHIIKYLSTQLGLSPVFVRSSELNVEGKRSQMVLNICKALKAERYLVSVGAEEYMVADKAGELFRNEEISVEILEYTPPIYPQLFGEFVPKLSAIDSLFNCGPENCRVLLEKGNVTYHSLNKRVHRTEQRT
jgi:hypothetical protein